MTAWGGLTGLAKTRSNCHVRNGGPEKTILPFGTLKSVPPMPSETRKLVQFMFMPRSAILTFNALSNLRCLLRASIVCCVSHCPRRPSSKIPPPETWMSGRSLPSPAASAALFDSLQRLSEPAVPFQAAQRALQRLRRHKFTAGSSAPGSATGNLRSHVARGWERQNIPRCSGDGAEKITRGQIDGREGIKNIETARLSGFRKAGKRSKNRFSESTS